MLFAAGPPEQDLGDGMSEVLRLRPRGADISNPRGGAPSHVAQAYGATQARARQPDPETNQAAPQATNRAAGKAARFGGAGNWALWLAALGLLGGGTVLGTILGGGPQLAANQQPRLVNVVQPAQAVARPLPAPAAIAAALPAETAAPHAADPHLVLPQGWQAAETARPALAPPPPPESVLAAHAVPTTMPLAGEMPAASQPLPEPALLAAKLGALPQLVQPAPSAAPVQPQAAPVAKATAKPNPGAQPVPQPQSLAAATRLAPPPVATSGNERWRQLAQAKPAGAKPPYIAIVIDDMGLDRRNSARAVNIPAPLTLSYMSYAGDLAEQSAGARAGGHEVMLHLPMEPLDAKRNDPGPQALYVGLDEAELRRRLTWALDRFDDYAGVNNHMGSRFTTDARGMAIVMEELQRRGRFWLDSLTGPRSTGLSVAAQRGLAATGRDLFIDDDRQTGAVTAQLATLERIARANGDAIGIGHPHGVTLTALEQWVAGAKARGFSLVPVSTVLRHRAGEFNAVPAAPAAPTTQPQVIASN